MLHKLCFSVLCACDTFGVTLPVAFLIPAAVAASGSWGGWWPGACPEILCLVVQCGSPEDIPLYHTTSSVLYRVAGWASCPQADLKAMPAGLLLGDNHAYFHGIAHVLHLQGSGALACKQVMMWQNWVGIKPMLEASDWFQPSFGTHYMVCVKLHIWQKY